MPSFQRLVIDSTGSAADFTSQCDLRPGGLDAVNNFANYIQGLAGGAEIGASLSFNVGAVKASGTVTFASTGPTAAQTCTVAGQTITAVASGAVQNQFNVSATPATVAANFAAAINASTNLQNIVTASALGAVVTVSASTPGKMGNGMAMANVNLANTTIVSFAGGSDGTAYLITATK